MRRFLVIRLSSVGDIVHALPAVTALAEAIPESEVHWAVEARYAVMLAGNPFVRRVVKIDTLGWRQSFPSPETLKEMGCGLAALREVDYEAAIDFQGLCKSALIARLSRARTRIGFAKRWVREPAAAGFYTERVAPRGRRHVIEWNLALVERLGARATPWKFPLPQTSEDDRVVEQQLARFEASEFIVISPGGGWTSKRWPPASYAALIRRLGMEMPLKIFLTGAAGEEALIHEIIGEAGSRCASYFPADLVQLIALLRRARLFVGGDTGPLHLAAAAGTPVVAVFSGADRLNTPERNGPFAKQDVVLCGSEQESGTRSDKGTAYLAGVSVEAVAAAIRRRLEKGHG